MQFDASRRGKKGLECYRDKKEERTVVGTGEKNLLGGPGSGGRRRKKRWKDDKSDE